jgi:TonB-dependent receptor
MKKLVQLLLLMTLPLVVIASPLKEGTLSVLLFSEGKPLANNEIKIDGKKVYKTDKDGAIKIRLVAGRHQIEIFGKSATGENLGYFKKPVGIKEGRDTEIIVTLSKTGADSIDIDVPVAVAASVVREAQKATGEGTLTGRVLSSEGNVPIAGARVFVRGTAVDVRTDDNGRFAAKVPSGKTLSISVVHSAYSAQTVGGIVVKKGGTTSRTVKLTPASMELEEFVVLAPKIEGSIADVIAEEKNINAVANILGSEEMSKKGDSTAAAALKRVTGVTLVDGKSIYVRGLGDRYSNVELNSMPLPSPDPMKRSVPLDIFPSSVIGSMKVQKSGSADIPSNFGGGYIDIRTKDKSDEDYIKISLGTSFNKYTGDAHIDYVGSATDWTGYDLSYRDIPQPILDATQMTLGEATSQLTTEYYTEEELADFTRMFVNRIYNVNKTTLLPGFSGSLEGSKSFKIDDDHEISIFATYGYSQKNTFRNEEYFNYDYDIEGNLIQPASQYGVIDQREMTVSHGGLLNIHYNFLDVLTLKYSKLYTKDSIKTTRVTDGILGSNDSHLTIYNLNWEERELNTDQFSGEIDYKVFNFDSIFSFGLQNSTTEFYQPNNYEYTYYNSPDYAYLYNAIANNIANNIEADDELNSFYIKNKHEVEIFNTNDEFVEYGFSLSEKERVSRQRRYTLFKNQFSTIEDSMMVGDIDRLLQSYVVPDIPYEYRPLWLGTYSFPADAFDGYLDEQNAYTSITMRPIDELEAVVGLRYVDLTQRIDEYMKDSTNPDSSLRNNIIISSTNLEVEELFPSLSLKYKYDDKNVFDIAASKTYIMPDFREVSGVYSHPSEPATILGNPELVNTIMYNLDLKYSYFISEDEFLKLGLFYKYMENPIEDVKLYSTSLPLYSFDNTEEATLYGLEIDGRKDLDFLGKGWESYYISGNFSYNKSEVTLTEEQEIQFTNNHRPLQGLSPYVANLTVGYDSDDRSVALNLNYMDERIRKVGIIAFGVPEQDQYETPPMLLDLVWRENLEYGYPFELKFKIGNILDDEIVWKEGDSVRRYFKTGPTLDMKISSKF